MARRVLGDSHRARSASRSSRATSAWNGSRGLPALLVQRIAARRRWIRRPPNTAGLDDAGAPLGVPGTLPVVGIVTHRGQGRPATRRGPSASHGGSLERDRDPVGEVRGGLAAGGVAEPGLEVPGLTGEDGLAGIGGNGGEVDLDGERARGSPWRGAGPRTERRRRRCTGCPRCRRGSGRRPGVIGADEVARAPGPAATWPRGAGRCRRPRGCRRRRCGPGRPRRSARRGRSSP